MIQIIDVDTGEGFQKHAWLQTAKSKADAKERFKKQYGYPPKDAFKMFPGVVCGPLDVGKNGGK
jgi:hypothetical protein